MKLDFSSMAFGYKVKSGGTTPNWATSLGQGKEYKINNNVEIDEILKGMVYTATPLSQISTKIGKGGKSVYGNADNSPIVLAGVFSKVYINDTHIENEKFILLITRDTSESHAGRLRLKYGPSNTYNDGITAYSNQDFINNSKIQLALNEDACWFVTDICVKNQNTLILRAIVVNSSGTAEYENNPELHKAWRDLDADYEFDINEYEVEDEDVVHCDGESLKYITRLKSSFSHNRILFGAPGTGKSYTLNEDKEKLIGKDSKDFERVTFHPDYSYAQFVGTYKPVPCKDSEDKDAITYEYVPGPFTRTLVKALKSGMTDNPKPHLLIVEEINRANVAAVFGDVFQLLDRDDNGVSEYAIQTSEDMRKYLAKELNVSPEECAEIKLPNNMFIWATMNSADQGVFPMDTAFKRRWDFTYIGINDSEEGIVDKTIILGADNDARIVNWNELRKAINDDLLTYKVNEDKLMGPYFISKNVFVEDENGNIDAAKFIKTFKNKVIMYLFDDAAKQKRPSLFDGCDTKNLYSEICREFDTKGVMIFSEEIRNKFNDKPIVDTIEEDATKGE